MRVAAAEKNSAGNADFSTNLVRYLTQHPRRVMLYSIGKNVYKCIIYMYKMMQRRGILRESLDYNNV